MAEFEEFTKKVRKLAKNAHLPPQGGNVALAQGFYMVWEVDFTKLGHFTKMGGNHQIMPNSPIIGEFLHNLVNSSIIGGIHLFPPFSGFWPSRAAGGGGRPPPTGGRGPAAAAARRLRHAPRGGRAPPFGGRALRRPRAACGGRAPPCGRRGPPAAAVRRPAGHLFFCPLPCLPFFAHASLLSPQVGYFIL